MEGGRSLLALWVRYRETGDVSLRNRLVLSLSPMVRHVVDRHCRRLPGHCDADDYRSAGLEALIRALDRYDADRGVSLEQFVWSRVNGAILDESRRQDWAPRSVRRFQRRREGVVREHVAAHGRPPGERELAAALDMSPSELRASDDRLATADVHSLNMPVGGHDDEEATELVDTLPSRERASQPEDALLDAELDGRMGSALGALGARERKVAELLYVQERTMREVGELLGVTESRVCQLSARIRRTVAAEYLSAA